MNTTFSPKERFRKSFVLVMTLAYAVMFFALIIGFGEALLLAAVFSGVVYPLYRWFQNAMGGRNTLASLMTLLTSVIVILIPLIVLLGLIAEQAAEGRGHVFGTGRAVVDAGEVVEGAVVTDQHDAREVDVAQFGGWREARDDRRWDVLVEVSLLPLMRKRVTVCL